MTGTGTNRDELPALAEIDSGSITVLGDVMTLTGDVDYVLVAAWQHEHPAPVTVTCVDAGQVTFLGSAGIAFLLRMLTAARPTVLQLRNPTRPALRPLQLMGVDQLLHITT